MFLDVVQGQEATAGSDEDSARLGAVRARIEAMIEGREPFTFVLEDPTGNSDVLQADVVRTKLSRHEAARLRSSEPVLDLEDHVSLDEEE